MSGRRTLHCPSSAPDEYATFEAERRHPEDGLPARPHGWAPSRPALDEQLELPKLVSGNKHGVDPARGTLR